MMILVCGLRQLAVRLIENNSSILTSSIERCQSAYLKRLECEGILVQLCYSIFSRKLGISVVNGIFDRQFDMALNLCHSFPRTAGKLRPAFMILRDSAQLVMGHDILHLPTLFTRECREILWRLPEHRPGSLMPCQHDHVFSAITWTKGCPECGPEVVADPTKDSASHTSHLAFLNEQDFRQAMADLSSLKFNSNAYGGRSQESSFSSEHGGALTSNGAS